MIPNRFVVFWNNQPVGLDQNSGGYPYKTDDPNLIQYFPTRADANYYVDVITSHGTSESFSGMLVKEIQFRIMEET